MRRYPAKPTADGFSSAWLDSPPFDPEPLMAWTAKLYDWYGSFFKRGERPYRVFLRFNPVNPGGGVGLINSFVVTYDQDTKSDKLKLTLAHEMFHTFAPALGDGFKTQWFSEGLAVYYQRLLPLRAGAFAPDAFLEDLNETAARYYTNALNTVPNDQIGAGFWEDTRIRVLPYDRGAMYLAVVDKRVRKASGGKRSLDDLVFALLDRQKKELPTTAAVWMELITSELGPTARKEYEAMLAGEVVLPDSDAFGPCFERRTAPLRRFELGFDSKIMGEPTRIIRGLIPGSEAERAGLRNGDEIATPVGLDSVQSDQKSTLTLQIRRDDKVFPVTYLPRGETIATYQWARVKGVADADCRY
jgi:predicted metalloprotease with PDZ domain